VYPVYLRHPCPAYSLSCRARHHPNIIPPPFASLPAKSRLPQTRYIISFAITTMSSSKTILASITKLNGQNWHTWSKEEAYLWRSSGSSWTEAMPTSAAALKRDKKAYAYIWFLVEPSSRDSIVEIKSGREAWAVIYANEPSPTAVLAFSPLQLVSHHLSTKCSV
jgi:hypothetical protein